jgi:hypothetical protein
MSANSNDPIVSQLYAIAKEWVEGHEKPGPANIIAFATALMCAVQKIANGKGGSYKRTIVLTIMAEVIENEVEFATELDKKAVLGLVETMVPPAIDAIVNVGQQLFNPENVAAACSCLGCK